MKCKICGERLNLLTRTLVINGKEHSLKECFCGIVYDKDGNDVSDEYYKTYS